MSKSLDIDPRLRLFGDHVRAHRVYLGLTQQDVASAQKVTRSSIANIEAGRQNIPLVVALDIAKFLGTSLGVLVGEADDPIAERMSEVLAELAQLEGAAETARVALREARMRVRVMNGRDG